MYKKFNNIQKEGFLMGYCFMTIQKVKTIGQLVSKYKHNYRTVTVDNADPDKIHLNEELVKLPNGQDYKDAFYERINSLPYYADHKIRSNAVLAFEVVTTFTKNSDIDLEKWKEKNVQWLENTFNTAPNKKNNVISVVYHGDEVGNVHCHAIVVPIDQEGHLNASHFTDGHKALTTLQTSYARDMKEFGLERGTKGSQAKHRDIKKFYADLNSSMNNLPKVMKGEDAESYRERCLSKIQEMNAAAFRERDEYFRKKQQQLDKKNEEFHKNLFKQFDNFKVNLQQENEADIKKKEQLKKELQKLLDKKKSIELYIEDKKIESRNLDKNIQKRELDLKAIEQHKDYIEYYDELKQRNPALVDKLTQELHCIKSADIALPQEPSR